MIPSLKASFCDEVPPRVNYGFCSMIFWTFLWLNGVFADRWRPLRGRFELLPVSWKSLIAFQTVESGTLSDRKIFDFLLLDSKSVTIASRLPDIFKKQLRKDHKKAGTLAYLIWWRHLRLYGIKLALEFQCWNFIN